MRLAPPMVVLVRPKVGVQRLPVVRKSYAPEYHQTDSGPPPTFADKKCQIGSYCMRAQNQLVDKETLETFREYTGFDDNPAIVEKVQGVCQRDITRFGGAKYECTQPRLFFIGPVENCDGHVNVFDFHNNVFYVTN